MRKSFDGEANYALQRIFNTFIYKINIENWRDIDPLKKECAEFVRDHFPGYQMRVALNVDDLQKAYYSISIYHPNGDVKKFVQYISVERLVTLGF